MKSKPNNNERFLYILFLFRDDIIAQLQEQVEMYDQEMENLRQQVNI
jgi:hypothetical protein